MVECSSRNCTSNSRATAGDSENRTTGGNKSAKIQIQVAQGVDEFLNGGGLRVRQIDLAIQLFAKVAPVEFDEGMFLADFTHDLIGDAGSLAQPRQVQLPHFSTAAHVVHQVVGVSFAANEGHFVSCYPA